MTVANVDEVLGLIGFGYMQLVMMLACSLTSIYMGNEIMGINAVTVDIVCEFSLHDTHISLVSSAGFAGMIFSSYHAGYITDQIGRRRLMVYSLTVAQVASFISILMPNFYLLILFRFIMGIAISGAGVNNITYMSEYICPKFRALVINLVCYAFAASAIWVPVVAYMLSPLDRIIFSVGTFNVRAWRLTMAIHIIPGILAVSVLAFLPETTKFLLTIGQDERAYKILDRLYKINRGQDLNSIGITNIVASDSIQREEKHRNCCTKMWENTVPLFRPPLRRNFLICTGILCGLLFVGNGIALWFLRIRGIMDHTNNSVCEMIDEAKKLYTTHSQPTCPLKESSFVDAMQLGCALLCCCIMITVLLLFMHRSYIIFMCAIISTCCGISLNFLKIYVLILVAMVFFSSFCSCCIPVISSVLVDQVPTHIRGMAINMSFMFARLAVVVANVLLGLFMMENCFITFHVFVAIIFTVAILTLLLPNQK